MLSALLCLSASAAPAVEVAHIENAHAQRPAWSPAGDRLSFEANFHDKKRIELYVGSPTPGGFQAIEVTRRATSSLSEGFARSAGGAVVHELAWAPAALGPMYVFAASNDAFDYDVYLSGGGALAPGPGADGGAAWAPDGRSIVFTSARTGEGDLYLLDTDEVEHPPQRLTTMRDSAELYVSWSPSGASLVFVAHTGSGDNLWLLPRVGASPARLTSWPGSQIRPRYAPNDERIAFYANREDPERFDLYVVKVGATPTRIATGVYPDARGPSWTADGRYIVFVADNDQQLDPIRAVKVDAPRQVIPLDFGTVGHGDLDVSPSGEPRIAFVSQGRSGDAVRDFRRLFVAVLPALP